MVDKRAHKRSVIELAASYGIGEDPRPEREAKINNVSSGGFCFVSDLKLREGQEIEVAIDLDTIREIMIMVRIVWIKRIDKTKKFTVGVQIVEKEGPDYEQFLDFYNKQL